MKTLIVMLFACSVGCATSNQCTTNACAMPKPVREVRVQEHTVWNYANGRMVVCTMRCVSDVDCSVVECQ